jgi:hypothetical protein
MQRPTPPAVTLADGENGRCKIAAPSARFPCPVAIFATDVSETAIRSARPWSAAPCKSGESRSPPGRRAEGDARQQGDLARGIRSRDQDADRNLRRPAFGRTLRPVLQGRSAPPARRSVWRRARGGRRTAGLHHDRPGHEARPTRPSIKASPTSRRRCQRTGRPRSRCRRR